MGLFVGSHGTSSKAAPLKKSEAAWFWTTRRATPFRRRRRAAARQPRVAPSTTSRYGIAPICHCFTASTGQKSISTFNSRLSRIHQIITSSTTPKLTAEIHIGSRPAAA